MTLPPMTLNEALKQFDLTEANLVRLEKLWAKLDRLIPDGVAFVGSSPEQREYDQLTRAFDDIKEALPTIDGWRITASPLALNDIAQARLDAREVEEMSAIRAVEDEIYRPEQQIGDYRHRMVKKRRELVRRRIKELVEVVDRRLDQLRTMGFERSDGRTVSGPEWNEMKLSVKEINRLIGATPSRGKAWNALMRHLGWEMSNDLWDIIENDWPGVKAEIESAALVPEDEPVPVTAQDLGAVVAERPAGPVTTALLWDRLSDEEFERLIFCLLGDAKGYEQPAWLTKTRAPDRGRDLSVTQVQEDALAGPIRRRVVVQCRHWLSRSVNIDDVSVMLKQMDLWSSPPVDTLVIATSGRFTTDAVQWIEQHNHNRKTPRIEMWPESHLERLLAVRPHLVAEFNLR
jgi:hypothetical protein